MRRAIPVNQKDIMKVNADTGIKNYLTLIGLIEKIWLPDQAEAVKNTAGYAKYSSAAAYNWADIDSILESGNQFMQNNLDALLNGGKGMLPGFPAEYTLAQDKYNSLYTQYLLAKQGINVQATGRMGKLNAVY